MNINAAAFVDNLYYMGIGMLGIFCVIGLIILVMLALNTFLRDKSSDDDNSNQN